MLAASAVVAGAGGRLSSARSVGHERVVLAQGDLRLAESAVAAHQPAQGVLAAVVAREQLAARVGAAGVVARVEAEAAKLVEAVQVRQPQVLASRVSSSAPGSASAVARRTQATSA
jgi:hypothetical protein